MNKKTVVLGASENPDRYSNMAVKKLTAHGHEVIAIGKRMGKIDGIEIHKTPPQVDNVDTVTLYLNPTHQAAYYDYICALHPKRIIFNPGAENRELEKIAENQGIETREACTLVMLSTGQY
ncbi:MAG: CoA-binding protein [Ferruginibacter sp.]|nr:CoA-binding protein [Ferruginibacter sp.]